MAPAVPSEFSTRPGRPAGSRARRGRGWTRTHGDAACLALAILSLSGGPAASQAIGPRPDSISPQAAASEDVEHPAICFKIKRRIDRLPPTTSRDNWSSLIDIKDVERPIWKSEKAGDHLDVAVKAYAYLRQMGNGFPDMPLNARLVESAHADIVALISRNELTVESADIHVPGGNIGLIRISVLEMSDGTIVRRNFKSGYEVRRWLYVVHNTDIDPTLVNWPVYRGYDALDPIIYNHTLFWIDNVAGQMIAISFFSDPEAPQLDVKCDFHMPVGGLQ